MQASVVMPERVDSEYKMAMLAAISTPMPKPPLGDWNTRRETTALGLSQIFSALPDLAEVQEQTFYTTSADGVSIEVYALTPKSSSVHATAAVLFIHGGGMIAGSARDFAKSLKAQVKRTNVPVFNVEYRLAPEVNGVKLVEDGFAALCWLHENVKRFNVDVHRIGVMGESAGGGIAAGVALMARDKGLQPPLAKQILIYPMLDDRRMWYRSADAEIERWATWSVEDNVTGWTALIGEDAGNPDAKVSAYCAPSRATDLSGLPPTYMDVGNLDLFCDEDIDYARRLSAAGVSVELHVHPGVPHAFELFAPASRLSQRVIADRDYTLLCL
jgi:acetyl esterase/lipase